MTKKPKRKNTYYSDEQKESLIKRMLPPSNESISDLYKETGISKSTLSTWKEKAKGHKVSKKLTSKEKFLIVMETYTMPEIKLSEYCRTKGLYVEEVKKWREACINTNDQEQVISKDLKNELAEEKRKFKSLEKELNRKEKALAEAAALLVLRKKLEAILGDNEEE